MPVAGQGARGHVRGAGPPRPAHHRLARPGPPPPRAARRGCASDAHHARDHGPACGFCASRASAAVELRSISGTRGGL